MRANHWGRESNLSPPCTRMLRARRGMRAHRERGSALLGGLGEKGAQEGFYILRPAGGASDPSCLPLLDRQGHTEGLVTFFAMKFIKRHPRHPPPSSTVSTASSGDPTALGAAP